MRTTYFFRNNPKEIPTLFELPQQPPKGNQILEEYLTQTKQSILTSDSQVHSSHTNIKTEELKALKSLKHNQDIIIKSADKGNDIVIENKTDNINNGLQHLNDRNIYEPLKADPTQSIAKEINFLQHQLVKPLLHRRYLLNMERKPNTTRHLPKLISSDNQKSSTTTVNFLDVTIYKGTRSTNSTFSQLLLIVLLIHF